ncbi:MAG: M20 family metallopeptidase [Asgard group archaeon]|nr:M20 family metallopeptidase [Asgard group archaeon]
MIIDSIINNIDEELIKRLTKELVALDSQNPPGKCDHIAKYLQEVGYTLGFESKIYEMDNDRHNIVLSVGSGEKDIILSGHLDTVPFGDLSQWKYPPSKVTEVNGKLFGRGTADMKGGVATLIAVMDAINRSDIELNHRIVFAGTADEEVGMNGAFHLKKHGIMDNAICLIITEATNLRVGIAEKGPFWVRIKVKGKAAHGSRPEIGKNAIEGACIAINHLKKLVPENSHNLLGKSTLNIGIINGGVKINIVPEDCSFDCDFRLVPGIDFDQFNSTIAKILTQLTNETGYNYSHEIIHQIPAISTDQNEPLVKGFLDWSHKIIGVPKEAIGLTYGTDAAALIPPDNIPFIIFGGGSQAILHQANEYIEFDQLVKATKTITAAIFDVYLNK